MASQNGRRRVVITGMGAVTPLGNDAETFWENLVAGESGAGPIEAFDPVRFAVHFACELKDFDPTTWIEHRKARRMDRFTQMILAAARMAEEDSGIEIAARDRADRRLGRDGHRRSPELPGLLRPAPRPWPRPREPASRSRRSSRTWALRGSRWSSGRVARSRRSAPRAPPRTWRSARPWTPSGSTVPTSMFAGGTEAGITKVGIGGFSAMRALSRRNDDPATREPALRRRAATASSWARPAGSSSSRSSSTRGSAARRSTPS